MTDEQIKKIAEEFARTQKDDLDQGYWDEERLSDRAYNNILDAYTESVIPIVQFITERYFVVERSKVVEILNDESYKDYEFLRNIAPEDLTPDRTDWYQLKNYADNMYFLLKSIISLGSETFDKKED